MLDRKISVVIPSYNEERHIATLHAALTAVLSRIVARYEIIFVNNASSDGSQEILDRIAAADSHVIALVLSRNFGSQGAHSAGMSVADGDAIVCMDGDLQDPPELIERFVEKWQEGFDVVYGARPQRKGTPLKGLLYHLFYRMLRRYAYVDIPLDAGDFALLDSRVVRVLNAMPEKDRFLRGLRAYAGFRQMGIEYIREERQGDQPKYSFADNFWFAYRSFFAVSNAPLRLVTGFALAVTMLSLAFLSYYLYLCVAVRAAPPGWIPLAAVVLLLGSIQIVSLSIIGEYVVRSFEEVKGRPSFIIDKIISHGRVFPGVEPPPVVGAPR
jgi:glycosyltransferase involved in cell wall biosynthesis